MTTSDPRPGFVRRLEELLAVVAYQLGYHPNNEVIAVLMRDTRIHSLARWDLDAPIDAAAEDLLPAALRDRITSMRIIGYGPPATRAVLTGLTARLHLFIPVVTRLLVADGHAFCLFKQCPCPASGGVAVDVRRTRIAAQMTVRGRVVLPSRRHLKALVDPDPAAQARTAALLTRDDVDERTSRRAVQAAMTLGAARRPLTDTHAARLAPALHRDSARQQAWLATGRHQWQQDLWLDLTRRVPDSYVSSPASLAAWSAWQRGETGLASMAWRRAVENGPPTQLTDLIAGLLASQITPDQLLLHRPGYRLYLR